MTDKQQIEQLEKDLDKIFSSNFNGDYESGIKDFGKRLYKANYRQVPPNAVVLTAEKIAEFETGCRKAWCEAWDKSRAKTAKEILQEVGKVCGDYQWFKNLCKQYGVEVDER